MARAEEGLKSEALLRALAEALDGESTRLEELLARHGAMPSPKPNLKLAQALGAQLAESERDVRPLLRRLSADDAAPNTAQVFLPIAAAHGWVARIRAGRDVAEAWAQLEALCADERGPVRVGALDALVALSLREGFADVLVTRATEWLANADRELCFGAAALVIEALGQARVVSLLRDEEALLGYLSAVIDKIHGASRASERSEGRRRALTSLAQALPVVVHGLRAGEQGLLWLKAECERASHPDVRRALSDAIVKLQAVSGSAGADTLRAALEASQKPARDPTLRRKGTGRGKHTRRTR